MKKSPTKSTDIALASQIHPDFAAAIAEGTSISTFLGRIKVFFDGAAGLERQSQATLSAAKATPTIHDKGGDEVVQTMIRRTRTEEKDVEAYWDVTRLFSQIHKRLVAGRTRATQPLLEARDIWTKLHNTYVDEATRAAQQEADRIRREYERKAQEDRQRALDALEAQALAAEDGSPDLSEREGLFVHYVMEGMSESRAAERAGFKDGFKTAARLLASEKIRKAITGRREAQALREQAAATKGAPVEMPRVDVKAEIGQAGTDVTTWSGEVLDLEAFVQAAVSGNYGIPLDVLTVDARKLNSYASSLKEQMNRWPGVRANKKTGVR